MATAKPKKTVKKNLKLQKWLSSVTPAVKVRLLELADTTECMLRQWVSGRRLLSASMAGRVEMAMKELHRTQTNIPDPLNRGDLCEACKKCPYLHQATKK